jgi:hypothetical protein
MRSDLIDLYERHYRRLWLTTKEIDYVFDNLRVAMMLLNDIIVEASTDVNPVPGSVLHAARFIQEI